MEIPQTDLVLVIYIVGQAFVALIAPLVTYYLARPHLQRVAAKAEQVAAAVEEVRVQTNGQTAKLEELARLQGFAAGQAEDKP